MAGWLGIEGTDMNQSWVDGGMGDKRRDRRYHYPESYLLGRRMGGRGDGGCLLRESQKEGMGSIECNVFLFCFSLGIATYLPA